MTPIESISKSDLTKKYQKNDKDKKALPRLLKIQKQLVKEEGKGENVDVLASEVKFASAEEALQYLADTTGQRVFVTATKPPDWVVERRPAPFTVDVGSYDAGVSFIFDDVFANERPHDYDMEFVPQQNTVSEWLKLLNKHVEFLKGLEDKGYEEFEWV